MTVQEVLRPGWKVLRFDQIATNVNTRIDDPSKSGMEHYVGLEHLDSDSLKIRRWGKPDEVEATKLVFQKGDIIFGKRRAYQRKIGVADFDGICSAHAMVIRANFKEVIPGFLPHFMQSDTFMERARQISVGSLSPTINWKTLAHQNFAIPSLSEQKKIVETLEASSETLHSLEDLYLRIESMYESFLLESFSKAERHGKPVKIAEIADAKVGIVIEPSKIYSDVGVIAIKHSNIGKGYFITDDLLRISHSGHEANKKSELRLGDVVLPRVSTIAGRPYYAAEVTEEYAGSNAIGIVILQPDLGRVYSSYLELFLNSPQMRRRLVGVAVGSIQRQLNINIIKEEMFYLLEKGLQEELAMVNSKMKSSISELVKRTADARIRHKAISNSIFGA